MPIKRLGYCCINMNLSDSYEENGKIISIPNSKKVLSSRTIRQISFSLEKVNEISLQNVKDLKKIIEWNIKNEIKLFRVSSDMFPFMDHPDYKYSIDQLGSAEEIKSTMKEIGKLAVSNGVRLTSHPGPYNCLGSPNEATVAKTIMCLEMHTLIGKLMGLEDWNINIHVGGSYGEDFNGTAHRFCQNFIKLSPNAKKWISLENDDKASLWTMTKLKNKIYERIGTPLVLDIHHWKFCQEESLQEAADMAFSTWGNLTPKIHVSESRTVANSPSKEQDVKPQAHSDYILEKIPELSNIEYDVMLECKEKEKALIRYRNMYNMN